MTWPLMNTLSQTCVIISYLVQTGVKGIVSGFCWWSYQDLDDEKQLLLKEHTQFKNRVQKPCPIYHNGQNQYPIYDQNGWKTIPFGAAHTHTARITWILFWAEYFLPGEVDYRNKLSQKLSLLLLLSVPFLIKHQWYYNGLEKRV